VQQDPRQLRVPRSRWRLQDLRDSLYFLAGYSLAGISKALRRLRVRLKRGRLAVHSPDPAYHQKFWRLAQGLMAALEHPDQVRLLFADEASIYRQPHLGPIWDCVGHEPEARLAAATNHCLRLAGALDAVSGQVTWLSRSKMRVPSLQAFLRLLRERYPDRSQRLLLVWDNWPTHYQPKVLATAEQLGIEILWLPTYAPWLNPIEKLWRLLKQTEVVQHRLAEQWEELKRRTTAFLDQYAHGSFEVLRYVGLDPTAPPPLPHRRSRQQALAA
jgi:transposase